MKILLVRHAKAVDGFLVPDGERTLTPEAIEDLYQYVPYLKSVLKDSPVYVYSSPLVRAFETATVYEKILSNCPVEKNVAILQGDLEDVLEECYLRDPEGTFILVGHEPTMGQWFYELTGEYMPFKKGAAAYIELSGEKPLLHWYEKMKDFPNLVKE